MVRKQEQSLAKARLGIKRFSKAPEEAEGEGVRGVSDGLLSVSRAEDLEYFSPLSPFIPFVSVMARYRCVCGWLRGVHFEEG